MARHTSSQPTRRFPGLVAALILVGLGARGAYWAATDGTRGFASRHWPAVPATIVAGSVEKSYGAYGTWEWSPKVTYSYSVGDERYTGHNVTFPPRRGARRRAVATLRRYPVGQTVTAYVNPDDPAQACLEPGPDWWFLCIIPFCTLLFLAGGVWLGVVAWRGSRVGARVSQFP